MLSSRRLALLLLLCPLAAPAFADDGNKLVGWVEKVTIEPIASPFKAKLDTGAATSSIGVEVVDIIEQEVAEKEADGATSKHKAGKVIFMIEDEKGLKKTLERNIVRWVRIKRKGKAGFIRRPVVHMRFCIAGRVVDDEVNLAVRERFIYPVLIGRNMLEKGRLMVDSSRTFTHPAPCPAAPAS